MFKSPSLNQWVNNDNRRIIFQVLPSDPNLEVLCATFSSSGHLEESG